MNRRRQFNRFYLQRQRPEDCLMPFGIAYLVVVIVTFSIMAVVNPNWDLKYPHILTPGRYRDYHLSQYLKPSKAYSEKNALLIAADRTGNIYVGNRIITLDDLRNLVMKHMKRGSGKVYIKADEACKYGRLMEIIRTCIDSGAKNISLLVAGRRYGHL